MNSTEKHLFSLLKSEIAKTFLASHAASQLIESWKGEEIVAFQEDLFDKVKTRVSEKWFYTHMKKEVEKLPRIDMLNMLSAYVGYSNWNDFKTKNTTETLKGSQKKKTRWWFILLAIPFVLMLNTTFDSQNTFNFCLVDEDKNEQITTIVNVKILQDEQSPIYLKTDSLGCFSFNTKQERIKFVVQSPFHKTDTIVRSINQSENAIVKLRTDDYAMMLQYYADGNKTDWKKRREKLNALISKDAKIYQMFSNNVGIEIYSKDEFIKKLTTPTQSLQRLKILDRTYKNEQIVKLKFLIQ